MARDFLLSQILFVKVQPFWLGTRRTRTALHGVLDVDVRAL